MLRKSPYDILSEQWAVVPLSWYEDGGTIHCSEFILMHWNKIPNKGTKEHKYEYSTMVNTWYLTYNRGPAILPFVISQSGLLAWVPILFQIYAGLHDVLKVVFFFAKQKYFTVAVYLKDDEIRGVNNQDGKADLIFISQIKKDYIYEKYYVSDHALNCVKGKILQFLVFLRLQYDTNNATECRYVATDVSEAVWMNFDGKEFCWSQNKETYFNKCT